MTLGDIPGDAQWRPAGSQPALIQWGMPRHLPHRLVRPALAVVAAAALAGCTGSGDGDGGGSGATSAAPSAGATDGSGQGGASAPASRADGQPFRTAPVAEFDSPWAMTFLPDGRLLVTEKGGDLKVLDPDSGEPTDVDGVPDVVDEGQGGLGDVVLAPDFATSRLVYLSWVEEGDGGTGAVIGRGRLADDASRLEGMSVIWRQTPKTSGSGHFSHRMAFSPDGRYLFVSSGDRQKMDPAQDLSSGLGKILRLTPDGTAAEGNPFADRGGVATQTWSYGHRNPLGLAFDADGNLWSSEMGPRGGDEINLVLEGRNYGWPKVSNGSHYDGQDIPDPRAGDGFEAPKVWWDPSISPGSLMIYSGDLFPDWKGDAFVGALSGQALIRVDLDGTTAAKGDQWDMGERIREVEQGPDGSIWLLQDGDDGALLKLTPPA